MSKTLSIILLLFLSLQVRSQIDPRLGYDLFKATNYTDALVELKKHLKVDPKDEKALFHIGLCYLNTNIDKAAAVGYLEKCLGSDKADKETLFYLAIAISHTYNYKLAIEKLDAYLQSPGKFIEDAKKMKIQYLSALEIYNNGIDVEFQNLGDKVNSSYADYAPFSSKDEKMIVFTSRREDGKGRKEFDGYFPSDIYITKFDGFRFANVKPASLNSNFDESCVGLSDDGSKMFLYYDNISEAGEIYESEESGGGFSKKKKIPEGVNDIKSIETAASISNDLQTLFYASNKDGGSGGLDLYMTRKLPNGMWGASQNIKSINTPGHEDFPSLASDGQTLYFCSDGLGGMGGYDLFKSTWNPETNEWSAPVNLGYPINTSYDDKVISFTNDEAHAYVSQVKPEGFGDYDIYRIKINTIDLTPAIYSIAVQDSGTSKNVSKATIFIYDSQEQLVGEFNGYGSNLTVVLKPGKYSLEIESDGYELSVQELKVSEFDNQKGIINLSYKLTK